MKTILYDNVSRFYDDTIEALMKSEIQNNLVISNSLRGKEGADTSGWFMATVKDDNGALVLTAIMTPPHNLLLYETDNIPDNDALNLIVKEIISSQANVTGIVAETTIAQRFSERYSSLSGKTIRPGKKLRIYRLDQVNEVAYSAGKFRPADESDLFYLPFWESAFSNDCGNGIVEVTSSLERVKRLISSKAFYIWEDNVPVSQAAMGRKTINGAVINSVYTPPYFRGKGYATSCVASLSNHLLESGYKFCSLFTDLANPISNSIYMKMGYHPVCDYDEYFFKQEI